MRLRKNRKPSKAKAEIAGDFDTLPDDPHLDFQISFKPYTIIFLVNNLPFNLP